MTTITTTTRILATVVTAGLLSVATACGSEPSGSGVEVDPAPAAPVAVFGHGSPDAVERRAALRQARTGSPDTIERMTSAPGCHVSADTAERLGDRVCGH